ncbi:MAG: hypothetical protein A2020_01355 [Lentisphaerae bacterium GWF2_45_14]|nr:MAG: hypothetical protein A2020_01355 [Lentisphaerae bacterium GWF2_45_14]
MHIKRYFKQFLKRFVKLLWSLIIMGLTAIVSVGVFVYLFQEKFIYVPDRGLTDNPGSAGLKYEDVELTTEDGTLLHAWFVPAENPKGVILFCHGNAGNLSDRIATIKVFYELEMDVMIFDYRGYGKSEGSPSEKGTYQDARAAWNYLVRKREIPPDKIIIVGRSMGGAIAAELAAEKAPAGVIIESAFISIPEIAKDLYPFIPLIRPFSKIKYDTAEYMKKINSPVMVIQSIDDEIINFRHGEQVFKSANSPKKFVKLSGSHNECYFTCESIYKKELKYFIRDCIKETPVPQQKAPATTSAKQ